MYDAIFVRRVDNETCEYKQRSYNLYGSSEWIYFTVWEPLTTTGSNPNV